MKHLDDIDAMRSIDTEGVIGSTQRFSDQCREAWDLAKTIRFSESYKKARNVVICGMGGSRFTPFAVREVFRDRIRVPVDIIEDYTLPAYVGDTSCVILSSYSGTTEEILSCGKAARDKKALVTGIAAGGPIIEFLKDNGYPYFRFDPVSNPSNQPRIGGGYLLLGHAGLLRALGYADISDSEVDGAIRHAREYSKTVDTTVPKDQNKAKLLAYSLFDKQVFVVSSAHLRGLANGFANQLNETAKLLSSYRFIPELNHHLMEGLARPASIATDGLFVFLVSERYSERILKRYRVTREVVEKQGLESLEVRLTGPNALAELLEGFVLSGFATLYLAMLYETNPASIPWVDYFKKELSKA